MQVLPYDILAQYLTIIDYEDHVLSVRPREFVSLLWTDRSLRSVHPDVGGAKNLSRAIGSINKRIAWVAREVIDYARRVGPAADCIEYFIRVARETLRLNNFCAFFQIVAALGTFIYYFSICSIFVLSCYFNVILFRDAGNSTAEGGMD